MSFLVDSAGNSDNPNQVLHCLQNDIIPPLVALHSSLSISYEAVQDVWALLSILLQELDKIEKGLKIDGKEPDEHLPTEPIIRKCVPGLGCVG